MLKKMLIFFIFIYSALFGIQTTKEVFVVSESWEKLTNEDETGLYFDLVRMIYEPAGIDVKIKVYPYKRSSMMVEKKLADVWLGSYLDEEDYALYPQYYFDHDIVTAMYKKKKFPNFKGLESLTNKSVCWIRGYDYDDYIDVPIQKYERNNRKSILLSLEKDRCDIFLDAEFDMKNAIEEFNFNISTYAFYQIFEFKLYPAFRDDEKGKILKEIWDKNFKILLEDGRLKQLYIDHKLEKYYLY